VLLSPPFVTAQQNYQKMSDEALSLAQAGKWSEAVAVAEKTLNNCTSSECKPS
jgi:hypothetical protein